MEEVIFLKVPLSNTKLFDQNTELLSNLLVDLHHGYDPNMVTEHKFDYEPAIER